MTNDITGRYVKKFINSKQILKHVGLEEEKSWWWDTVYNPKVLSQSDFK